MKGCERYFTVDMGMGCLHVNCGQLKFPFGFGRFYCKECVLKQDGERK